VTAARRLRCRRCPRRYAWSVRAGRVEGTGPLLKSQRTGERPLRDLAADSRRGHSERAPGGVAFGFTVSASAGRSRPAWWGSTGQRRPTAHCPTAAWTAASRSRPPAASAPGSPRWSLPIDHNSVVTATAVGMRHGPRRLRHANRLHRRHSLAGACRVADGAVSAAERRGRDHGRSPRSRDHRRQHGRGRLEITCRLISRPVPWSRQLADESVTGKMRVAATIYVRLRSAKTPAA
jgi:hypothetical protein